MNVLKYINHILRRLILRGLSYHTPSWYYPVGQSRLQAGRVLGRVQPGGGVPDCGGKDSHLLHRALQAPEQAGPGAGSVRGGLGVQFIL